MAYAQGSRKWRSSEEAARKWATVLFWSTLSTGLVMVYYVVAVFVARPVVSLLLTAVALLLWHYLTRADSVWHQSQHLENQFWMLVTFLTTAATLFAPDSPYSCTSGEYVSPRAGRVMGWASVVGTTMMAHFVDKQHHRNRLRGTPGFERFTGAQSTTAEGKIELLQRLVGQLDRTLPSTLHTLWNISQYVRIEREILAVFTDCSKEELNYVVLRSEMKLLAYKLKNHNKTTSSSLDLSSGLYSKTNRSRSGLMDILAVRRVSDLGLAARAIVLDIIQGLRMTAHPDTESEAQGWVMNLLVTVKGDELSELKQLVDNKGSAESMHKLVHIDITDEHVRRRILDHFKKQASIQAAQLSMGGSLAKKRRAKGAWRKILSDVDDTLFSSGGRYPAGIDTSYKRKVFYPGVTAFYRELDLGTVGPEALRGVWPPSRFGDLVFLSARPHVYKDLTETSMYAKFRKFMRTHNLHCMPSLLPGDLESGQAFMMKGDFMPMALKKMRNFEQYNSIYPEFTHVFIGDNGQADVKAAEFMVETFGRKVVERVYIHEVQPRQFTFGYEAGVSEDKWERYGIVFCKTYIGAALDAARNAPQRNRLILHRGLRRVMAAARSEFLRIRRTWRDPYERDTRRLELNADIEEANQFLVEEGRHTVPPIPGEQVFPRGTKVFTGFGVGYVSNYRGTDGIYEVVLDWKSSATDPPRLYTVLHAIYTSERTLKEVQRKLAEERAQASSSAQSPSPVAPPQMRNRSATAETELSHISLRDSAMTDPPPLLPQTQLNQVVRARGAASEARVPSSASSTVSAASGVSSASSSSIHRFNSGYSGSGRLLGAVSKATDKRDVAEAAEALREGSSPRLAPSVLSTGAFYPFGFITGVTTYKGSVPRGAKSSSASLRRRVTSDNLATTGRQASALGLPGPAAPAPSPAFSLDSASESGLPLTPPRPASTAMRPSVAATANGLQETISPGRGKSVSLSKGVAADVNEALVSGSYGGVGGEEGVTAPPGPTADVLEVGATVTTPYGSAVVLRFREKDDIYELAIPRSNVRAYVSEVSLILWNGKLFQERANEMVREGSYPSRLFGLMKNLFVRGDNVAGRAAPPGGASGDASQALRSDIVRDAIVKTPYGQGSVLNIRKSDRIYEIRLVWGARAFLNASSVDLDDTYEPVSADEAAAAISQDQSPLQKARSLVAKNWALLKLPFSVLGGSAAGAASSAASATAAGSAAHELALPNSVSLLSLSSLASANSTTSSSSYFSLPEEQQRLTELWKLQPGDQVDTNGFGVGTIIDVRADGFFVVQLSYGVAYINVPRVLVSGARRLAAAQAAAAQARAHAEAWGQAHERSQAPERAGFAYAPGTRVLTEYGVGTVEFHRQSDNVYGVKMESWSAFAYISGESPSALSPTGKRSRTLSGQAGSVKPEAVQGSLRSSFLSFLSNIIPGSGAAEEPPARQAPSTPLNLVAPLASPRSFAVLDSAAPCVSFNPAVHVGHTAFSFNVARESIPPGHTAFSWAATVDKPRKGVERPDGA